MNIQKSKIIVVPETKLTFTVRIDLVRPRRKDSGWAWVDIKGTIHMAAGTAKPSPRYFVTIVNEQGFFPIAHLLFGGSPHLCTQSRVQAEACYSDWVNWAQKRAAAEESLAPYNSKLPTHSEFWNL
jgi:hypothetical protein